MSDPISDVLRSVRLTGGVFLDVRLTAPFCVISELTAADCRPLLDDPVQIVFYHVVLSGRATMTAPGDDPVEVAAGELAILPHNDTHVISSAPGLRPTIVRSLVQPAQDGGLARVVHGGGGEETHMVCGFLGSTEARNPLFTLLPRLLKLDLGSAATRDWIESSARFAAAELAQGRLASSGVMSRLSEVLFVEAVRQFAAAAGPSGPGWLRGLADPQVGRALAAIHRDPAAAWTADALAREAGLSRSAFSERFAALVGGPPIRYLARWRLHLARQRLREGGRGIARIAHEVGYDSEEAFSRAFKRETGLSPARWRDAEAARAAAAEGSGPPQPREYMPS
ncbi:AraC family transcriptional regulator [Albidovulum sp.]|jgi:AraC-like DNA-binding protein|uniref:AraC family transcriptional regulator n=2 Tax=Albidovulum sp. TaxID=1872424 RepID=UPI003020AF1B